jgi:hypothetical protein
VAAGEGCAGWRRSRAGARLDRRRRVRRAQQAGEAATGIRNGRSNSLASREEKIASWQESATYELAVRRCVGEPDPLSLRRRTAEHNRAVEVKVFDTNFIDCMVSNPMLIHSWIISDFEY